MSPIPTPHSPHLYPQVNISRPSHQIGLVEDALVRSANGAKKLLPAWSRPGVGTPDASNAAVTLARSRSQLDMVAWTGDAMSSYTADPALRSSSRASKHVPSDQRPPTLARSFIHKSSRLLQKRKSTPKLRTAPTVSVWEDDEEPMPLSLPNILQKAQPQPTHPPLRKESISEPFNFQHITHTNSKHAKTLQDARVTNLMTEFCAFRAAQKPHNELKGIKADNLPSATQSEAASLASASAASTAHHTPATSRPTTPGQERSLHASKSVDNFRLMNPRSFSTPLGPVIPPPRRSSRKPVDLAKVFVDTAPCPGLDSPTLPTPATLSTLRSPDSQHGTAVSTPATELSSDRSPVEIAQAVTTPDDSACEMVPRSREGPSTTHADRHAEEEPASRAPERSSSTSLRHSKSMPTVKHFSRIWASSTSLASATDPTLPSPDRYAEELPAGPTRRFSMAPKPLHESWEDSVDYCYDYAMDENDFEEGLTMDGGLQDTTPTGAVTPAMTGSANSSAVSFHGVATPSNPMPSPGLVEVPRDVDGGTLFQLSPSLLVPKEYSSRVTHEEHYDQALTDVEPKGAGYTEFFFPPLDGIDLPLPGSRSSPRSSRTPLSKSSSHDSFASRMYHPPSGSGGSTPSLVRGKASREQLAGFPGAAADLSSALTSGMSTITDAIDSMRRDLIRAAEEMPEAQFAAAISPTLTPPPSRLTVRTACPSPDHDGPFARPTAMPRYVGDSNAPPQQPSLQKKRQRASSAAHLPPTRAFGHRTSYSLFPTNVRV